jgi:hypothetical protein
MPCPFFLPLRTLGPGPWNPAPRLPLGEAWGGECRAPASENSILAATILGPQAAAFEPPETEQRELCNSGYARGQCKHFPADSAADAVRFSFIGQELSSPSQVIYILEKDHAPLQYGVLDLSVANLIDVLTVQAKAFAKSHGRLSRVVSEYVVADIAPEI